jgi:hypothetical protein
MTEAAHPVNERLVLVIQYQYLDQLILTSTGFLSLGWNPDLSQEVSIKLPALFNAYPVTLPICFFYSGHGGNYPILQTLIFDSKQLGDSCMCIGQLCNPKQ